MAFLDLTSLVSPFEDDTVLWRIASTSSEYFPRKANISLKITQNWMVFFFLQHVQPLFVHLVNSKIMIYRVLGLNLYCNPSWTLYDACRELIDLGRQNESEFYSYPDPASKAREYLEGDCSKKKGKWGSKNGILSWLITWPSEYRFPKLWHWHQSLALLLLGTLLHLPGLQFLSV